MRNWTKLMVAAAFFAAGCGADEGSKEQGVCGNGEEVKSGSDIACVYRGELIEEGFACPASVPNGFLLSDGGVACVGSENMPDGLGGALEGRGYEPAEAGCFEAVEPGPECLYETEPVPTDDPAFDTSGATTISFSATGGFGFCIETGDITTFTINVPSGRVTAEVLVPGPAGSDQCVPGTEDDCRIAETTQFVLTDEQLADVMALLDAVPAPECEVDPGLACDPCVVESLSVDDTSVSTFCCGDQKTAGFDDAFNAAADYLRSLIPQAQPAFDNADSFTELTYQASGGLGFCIDGGDLLDLTITRAADGSLSLEGQTVEIGDPATDDCLQTPDVDTCLVATSIGPQTLTVDAQAELEARLAEVPAPMCVDDPGMACDPCLIEDIAVDGVEVSGYCCGSTTPGFSTAFTALIDHLQSL